MGTGDYVLYAEDDPDDIEFLRKSLEHTEPDKELIAVPTGEELVQYLENYGSVRLPCLIVLDMSLPKMDGEAILRYLHQHPNYQFIPVVLFSTTELPKSNEFIREKGIGFVLKPSNLKEW